MPQSNRSDACSFSNIEGQAVNAVVENMYFRFKEYCTETGFRFHTAEQLQAHKDAVFEDKRLKSEGAVSSRKWYQGLNVWLGEGAIEGEDDEIHAGDLHSNEAPEDAESKATAAIPWTTGLDTCPICAEDFEKYWDDNADGGNGDWMVRNALDPGSGQVVHEGCWKALQEGSGIATDDGTEANDETEVGSGQGEGATPAADVGSGTSSSKVSDYVANGGDQPIATMQATMSDVLLPLEGTTPTPPQVRLAQLCCDKLGLSRNECASQVGQIKRKRRKRF